MRRRAQATVKRLELWKRIGALWIGGANAGWSLLPYAENARKISGISGMFRLDPHGGDSKHEGFVTDSDKPRLKSRKKEMSFRNEGVESYHVRIRIRIDCTDVLSGGTGTGTVIGRRNAISSQLGR